MSYPRFQDFGCRVCFKRWQISFTVRSQKRMCIYESSDSWNNVNWGDSWSTLVIDKEGLRYNVGIIIMHDSGELLWCKRVGHSDAWQFPQGGMLEGEQPLEAMYRELQEELGLEAADVEYLMETSGWLSYRLPKHYIRHDSVPLCVGQKQKWFLLKLVSHADQIDFNQTDHPEFDRWRWVDYWHPVNQVIEFKRSVYEAVLREFEPIVHEKKSVL